MSLRSYLKEVISDFRGTWLVRDQPRQSSSRASYAQNVRFRPGGVRSREGFSLALELGTGAIKSLYNWISRGDPVIAGTSRLVYFEAPNVVAMYDLTLSALVSLYTQTCDGISVAEAETRLYIAHYDANGVATGDVKVVNALVGGSPADTAFPAPMADVPTISEVGPGDVVEGLHYVAYRLETRTGFPGAPGPVVAGIFSPVAITVGAGGKELQFSFTINIPSDASIIHILMTSVDDPDTFYETGFSISVPAGASAWPVSLNFSISDAALALASNDATDKFSYLNGATRPRASKVGRYGNRTLYIADKKIYLSDPYSAQILAEDQHAVQVEGQVTIVTAEPLGSVLVLFCLNSTFVVSGDNARYPREWAPPQRRSGAIGTPCPNGVIAAAGLDGLWVAHPSGLNFFNGSYGDIPLSIMFETDWKRINWVYATTLQMVDNPEERCLYISVPLDAATAPNYRMVIDYSRAKTQGGVNPYDLDYSLDVYKIADVVTALPSMGRVQNQTTKKNEVWYGKTDGTVIRRDPAVIADLGEAIHAIWETGLVLSRKLRQLSRFGGVNLDAKGSGSLTVTPYGLNKQQSADDAINTLALSSSPDGELEARWHLTSENESIRFETNSATASFEINGITAYHKPVGSTRADN